MTTKKLPLLLLGLFVTISSFAVDKELDKDLTMVSYEQTWRDSNGTLALRNNTTEEIHNVVFIIQYLDMSGNDLDYKEFNKTTTIAPGMTKKLNIPAYEHDRRYHYYKSEGLYDNTSFKIKFQLKDYNTTVEEKKNNSPANKYDIASDTIESINYAPIDKYNTPYNPISDFKIIIIGVIAVLVMISISIGLYVLVAVMAQKRNRSVVVWVLLSLLATPLLMIIILLAIGNEDNYQRQ